MMNKHHYQRNPLNYICDFFAEIRFIHHPVFSSNIVRAFAAPILSVLTLKAALNAEDKQLLIRCKQILLYSIHAMLTSTH